MVLLKVNKMVEEGYKFKAIDGEDNTIDCEVVMSFIADNGKAYVFYTDNTYDEDGDLTLYASRYLGESSSGLELEDIETEKEWALLDKVLEKAKEGLKG